MTHGLGGKKGEREMKSYTVYTVSKHGLFTEEPQLSWAQSVEYFELCIEKDLVKKMELWEVRKGVPIRILASI